MDILERVKLALRITTDDFDEEINDLINSAKTDLNIAGVILPEELTSICNTAIVTYCKMNFGNPDEYDRLKKAYDEQKAQLGMTEGYTNWLKENG